jgi:mannitol/fructose-specific phosphotransferase system IIA component
MPAYIALPHGTEDGIANRVQHQITIGMRLQGSFLWQAYAGQHQGLFFVKA